MTKGRPLAASSSHRAAPAAPSWEPPSLWHLPAPSSPGGGRRGEGEETARRPAERSRGDQEEAERRRKEESEEKTEERTSVQEEVVVEAAEAGARPRRNCKKKFDSLADLASSSKRGRKPGKKAGEVTGMESSSSSGAVAPPDLLREEGIPSPKPEPKPPAKRGRPKKVKN